MSTDYPRLNNCPTCGQSVQDDGPCDRCIGKKNRPLGLGFVFAGPILGIGALSLSSKSTQGAVTLSLLIIGGVLCLVVPTVGIIYLLGGSLDRGRGGFRR